MAQQRIVSGCGTIEAEERRQGQRQQDTGGEVLHGRREQKAECAHHSALSQFARRCGEPEIGGDAMVCTLQSAMDASVGVVSS